MSCASPASWEALVAYWAGDLDAHDEAAIEEHVMGCAACSAQSARVAAITEAFRGMIAPIVSRAELERLRAKGLRVREEAIAPGARHAAWFPSDLDLLVFRLGGVDLARARRVSFAIRAEGSDTPINAVQDAPFDRDADAVLLVCQQHFASLPGVAVAELRVVDDAGHERRTSYVIDHRFERAGATRP